MAGKSSDVPDVTETDLSREDLEEAARELDLEDTDDLDDQALFERIGVGLGELDPDAVETEDRDDEDAAEPTDEPQASGDEAGTEPDAADTDAADTDTDDTDAAEADTDEDDADDGDDEDDADDGDDVSTTEQRTTPVHDEGEYRFEDDPRDGVEPVLDLELGPLALDVLGVEVHLKRVHAVLTANPNANRNLIGKLLAALARATDRGGGQADDGDDGDGGGGVLSTLTSPLKRLVGRGGSS